MEVFNVKRHLLRDSHFHSLLFSQSVIESGYTAPWPVSVAPGQIATFYVQLPSGVSPNIIGVTLQQGSTNTNVPLQSLRTLSECPDSTAVSNRPVLLCWQSRFRFRMNWGRIARYAPGRFRPCRHS